MVFFIQMHLQPPFYFNSRTQQILLLVCRQDINTPAQYQDPLELLEPVGDVFQILTSSELDSPAIGKIINGTRQRIQRSIEQINPSFS